MADKVRLAIKVDQETLINLKRHSLYKSGAGKTVQMGAIIDELVQQHLPDYLALDNAHGIQSSEDDETPKVVHDS